MPPSLKRFAITLVGIALGYAAIKALSDLLWRTWGAELAAARTGGASFMVPCLVVLVVVAVRWTESRPRWRGAPLARARDDRGARGRARRDRVALPRRPR